MNTINFDEEEKTGKHTIEACMSFRIIPGTRRVIVEPLTGVEPISGSIMRINPAAAMFLMLSAMAARVAASYSKSNEYVQIISFPRARDGMKSSGR